MRYEAAVGLLQLLQPFAQTHEEMLDLSIVDRSVGSERRHPTSLWQRLEQQFIGGARGQQRLADGLCPVTHLMCPVGIDWQRRDKAQQWCDGVENGWLTRFS